MHSLSNFVLAGMFVSAALTFWGMLRSAAGRHLPLWSRIWPSVTSALAIAVVVAVAGRGAGVAAISRDANITESITSAVSTGMGDGAVVQVQGDTIRLSGGDVGASNTFTTPTSGARIFVASGAPYAERVTACASEYLSLMPTCKTFLDLYLSDVAAGIVSSQSGVAIESASALADGRP